MIRKRFQNTKIANHVAHWDSLAFCMMPTSMLSMPTEGILTSTQLTSSIELPTDRIFHHCYDRCTGRCRSLTRGSLLINELQELSPTPIHLQLRFQV